MKKISMSFPWFSIKQRPHHIAGIISECFDTETEVFLTRGIRDRICPSVGSNIKLIYKWRIPGRFGSWAKRYNEKNEEYIYTRYSLSHANMHIFSVEPFENRVQHLIRNRGEINFLVYDCLDDMKNFPNLTKEARESIIKGECILCENADQIWVSANSLYEMMVKSFGVVKVRYVPNGVHFDCFSNISRTSGNRPVLGYVGALAPWVNYSLIREVAMNLLDWDVVMVGPVISMKKREIIEKFRGVPNISIKNPVRYEELPAVLSTFSVGMIPFNSDDPLIKATNPVKFYEYMAAGLPTVSTKIQSIAVFEEKGVLSMTDDPEEFAYFVRNSESDAKPNKCRELSLNYDWQVILKKALAETPLKKE